LKIGPDTKGSAWSHWLSKPNLPSRSNIQPSVTGNEGRKKETQNTNSRPFLPGRSVRAMSHERITPMTNAIDCRTTASDTVFHNASKIERSLKARFHPANPYTGASPGLAS
jgi:hypothetical protein